MGILSSKFGISRNKFMGLAATTPSSFVFKTTDVLNVLRFFIHVTFCTFLTFFPRFLNNVNRKAWVCKNPTKNTLIGCLSNDFYWFWFVTWHMLQNILLTCWRALI